MRAGIVHRVALVLGAVVMWYVTAAGAAAARDSGLQPVLAPHEVAAYSGTWECRWGDSPRDPSGARLWARPAATAADAAGGAGDWRPCAVPGEPLGRAGHRYLWLRTRLTGPIISDLASRPALFLLVVDHSLEAYLDGAQIYRFGVLDAGDDEGDARRFSGFKSHYIPIGDGYQGKTLALRIYSDHTNIGITGQVYVGSQLALTLACARRGQARFLIGAVLGALGLVVLALFALQRREASYAYFGSFVLCAGVWEVAQAQSRTLFVDMPLLWVYLDFGAFYLMPPLVISYLIRLIGEGPMGLTLRLAQLFWLYLLVSLLLIVAGISSILSVWLPYVLLLMSSVIYMVGMTLIAALQGNAEARIYSIGLAIAGVLVLYDSLTSLGILPRRDLTTTDIGLLLFVISLAIIPARRYLRMQRQLQTSSAELQEKLHQLEEQSAKVRSLNDELMRQIEQRSRRLLDTVLAQRAEDPSDPTGSMAPRAAGDMLGEVYRIERPIGQGGFGAVYEVLRVPDQQHFAAKILTRTTNRSALIRFAREAQLLAKFSHKNLVSVVDVDVTADGSLFIIMELVKGMTLGQLRSRFGDVAFALPILRQICGALSAVHERGIVHRDLKPANILVAEGGAGKLVIKLADFGISVLARSDDATPSAQGQDPLPAAAGRVRGQPEQEDLTATGMLVGTPMYMAPELCVGSRHAQPPSDIFSLGVIAHELLTRELPYRKPAISSALNQETLQGQSRLRACPGLDASLALLFERCLSVDPAQRPSAQELVVALSTVAAT